jgi:hypothetical protein
MVSPARQDSPMAKRRWNDHKPTQRPAMVHDHTFQMNKKKAEIFRALTELPARETVRWISRRAAASACWVPGYCSCSRSCIGMTQRSVESAPAPSAVSSRKLAV